MRSPQDIAKLRQEERAKLTPEQRQLAALDSIADTLESLRIFIRRGNTGPGVCQRQAARLQALRGAQ